MKKLLTLALFIGASSLMMAQDILGEWNNIDPKTGQINSTITISKRGNSYFGKITDITNPEKRKNLCTKCEGDLKNKPVLGMEILRNLKKNGKRYDDGEILDPKTGKDYTCAIWVDEDDNNKLKVRGYIGLFYSTREWVRKK
jgi:uncharacterized protein (DUF2147 family)